MSDGLFDLPGDGGVTPRAGDGGGTLAGNAHASAPLAVRMRPRSLDELVGQEHLLAPGSPLRQMIDGDQPLTILLWGPPGTGKTTIASLLSRHTQRRFIEVSAVSAGVKEVRDVIAGARRALANGVETVLFVDEVHRFNKSQQDALLPYAESGLVTFIGATTENPSFEVNSALLSRAQVYVLKSLSDEELRQLFDKAAQTESLRHLSFDELAIDTLIGYADGDARRFLNLLEQSGTAAQASGATRIDAAFIENALTLNARRFDKGGDSFYDQISALHKSVRGSDPDASLYWLCRMLDGGADPRYLSRRIIRMAWEDIGLADPRALQIANDAAQTYERLGSPEGELALAQAVIYLAVAAKSNAGYMAYNQARAFIKKDKSREVPVHLRNAPTKLMKELGHGREYRYAHDEPHGYAAGETYLPDGMPAPGWYRPVARGLESKIADKLAFLKSLDDEAGGKGGA